MFFWILDYLK